MDLADPLGWRLNGLTLHSMFELWPPEAVRRRSLMHL